MIAALLLPEELPYGEETLAGGA